MKRISILPVAGIILLSVFALPADAQTRDGIPFGKRRIASAKADDSVNRRQTPVGSADPGAVTSSVPAHTDGGFWVIESNKATPENVIVRFYEEGNLLIYIEHLSGVPMDLSKRKTRRKLDQSLRDARSAWQKNKTLISDKGLVASRFGVTAGASWVDWR